MDQWICDESQLRILTSYYPTLKGTTCKSLNTLIGKLAGSFDASNTNRVYYAQFKVPCPVQQSSQRSVSFWYRGSKDIPVPSQPTQSSNVVCAFANSPSVKRDTIRTVSVTRDLLNSQQQKMLLHLHLPHSAVAKNVWIRQRNRQRNEKNERVLLTKRHETIINR